MRARVCVRVCLCVCVSVSVRVSRFVCVCVCVLILEFTNSVSHTKAGFHKSSEIYAEGEVTCRVIRSSEKDVISI